MRTWAPLAQQAEVLILDRLRHGNLVELVGYCKEKGECLLVYHYYANDSVESALFNRKPPYQLPSLPTKVKKY
ncbi:unnamed protein product, partial [Closterium sp. NIES-54]